MQTWCHGDSVYQNQQEHPRDLVDAGGRGLHRTIQRGRSEAILLDGNLDAIFVVRITSDRLVLHLEHCSTVSRNG
jgi:hypothetical protein